MAPTVNCFKGRFDRHNADNRYSMEWRQRRAENAKRQPDIQTLLQLDNDDDDDDVDHDYNNSNRFMALCPGLPG